MRRQSRSRAQLEADLRFSSYLVAFLVAVSGSLVIAQKVTNPDELDKVMKKVQPAMQATQKAVKSEAYADARTQLGIIKQVMEDSRAFWVMHKKEDAIKANQETVAKIDAVDQLLAATPVDASAVQGALKEMGAACLTCHKIYRVRDTANEWVLKPGSIGG
jgi:cytochrome c556